MRRDAPAFAEGVIVVAAAALACVGACVIVEAVARAACGAVLALAGWL